MTAHAVGVVRGRGWNVYLSDIVEWTLTLIVALVMSISEPPAPKEESTPQPTAQEERPAESK